MLDAASYISMVQLALTYTLADKPEGKRFSLSHFTRYCGESLHQSQECVSYLFLDHGVGPSLHAIRMRPFPLESPVYYTFPLLHVV